MRHTMSILLVLLLAGCTGSPADVQIWGGQGSEPGQFNEPFDVAVGADGFVYCHTSGLG